METAVLQLPTRGRGRQNQASIERYQAEVEHFCEMVEQIASRLDFNMSSRGWCYVLEKEVGLLKSEFDQAQTLINDCRKSGLLPMNICLVDENRAFSCLERVDNNTIEEEAEGWVDYVVKRAGYNYTPFSFWDDKEYYIEMLVEKIDLRQLFEPICQRFRIPIANAKGWPDLHVRYSMMKRYKLWEEQGKTPVLLYCGDHDPAGLHISDSYRDMFTELSAAVDWEPNSLIIDRFGLNVKFIYEAGLSWIDNLITGGKPGKNNLADPEHPDHNKPYVQEYLKNHGARKVEANAIVVAPEMGRKLCLEVITEYIPEDAPDEYEETISLSRQEVLNQVSILLREHFAAE